MAGSAGEGDGVGVEVIVGELGVFLIVVLLILTRFVFFGMKKKVKTAKITNKNTHVRAKIKLYFSRIVLYFTMRRQIFGMIFVFILGLAIGAAGVFYFGREKIEPFHAAEKSIYWFVLLRTSNIEHLYRGVPGDEKKSKLIKTFAVKTGIPGERPTPLPELLGRGYWIIIERQESKDNPETAPYFLSLNIPVPEEEPYGPSPYLECNGQCSWGISGEFGLHGVNGDISRLSNEDLGSSGCIRHSDADITYLYNLLDPKNEEVRYYIEDV